MSTIRCQLVMLDAGFPLHRVSSIGNRGEEMPLGYVLRTGEILAYYGLERKDIAEAIFRYGRDRRIIMTTEPGTLGRGGGQAGFRGVNEILALVQQALEDMEGVVPRRYPGFHGTLGRFPVDGGFMKGARKGADVVIDIDVKGDYAEAFKEGRKVLDFLDSYNAPYRVKFSGGSGPHIIIPCEAFPEPLSAAGSDRAHKLLFQMIGSRSKANHIDGSLASTSHFLRLPYSLNENTGLVSLPLRREQYDDFTLSMAEVPNVQVDDEWFQEPDEGAREALLEMLQDGLGRSQNIADILQPTSRDRRRRELERSQRRMEKHTAGLGALRRRMEEHTSRLRQLEDLGAPHKVIRQEKQMLREVAGALKERGVETTASIRDLQRKLRRSLRSEDNGDD